MKRTRTQKWQTFSRYEQRIVLSADLAFTVGGELGSATDFSRQLFVTTDVDQQFDKSVLESVFAPSSSFDSLDFSAPLNGRPTAEFFKGPIKGTLNGFAPPQPIGTLIGFKGGSLELNLVDSIFDSPDFANPAAVTAFPVVPPTVDLLPETRLVPVNRDQVVFDFNFDLDRSFLSGEGAVNRPIDNTPVVPLTQTPSNFGSPLVGFESITNRTAEPQTFSFSSALPKPAPQSTPKSPSELEFLAGELIPPVDSNVLETDQGNPVNRSHLLNLIDDWATSFSHSQSLLESRSQTPADSVSTAAPPADFPTNVAYSTFDQYSVSRFEANDVMTPQIRSLGDQLLSDLQSSSQSQSQSHFAADVQNTSIDLSGLVVSTLRNATPDSPDPPQQDVAIDSESPTPRPQTGAVVPIEPLAEFGHFNIFTAVTDKIILVQTQTEVPIVVAVVPNWTVAVSVAAGATGWVAAKSRFSKDETQTTTHSRSSQHRSIHAKANSNPANYAGVNDPTVKNSFRWSN